MTDFLINAAEWDALFDEPHALFKVYCCLRRHMDYGTGLSGTNRRRLSEQQLIELLSTPSSPGRAAERATRKTVRYSIDRLKKLGLAIPRPDVGAFVFHLPAATTDQSAQMRWGQGCGEGGATGGAVCDSPKPLIDKANIENFGEGGAIGESEVGPEVGPTSGNPTTTSTTTREPDHGGLFGMHADWQPRPDGIAAAMRIMGVPSSAYTPEALAEFKSYHALSGGESKQGGWEHKLAKHLKRGAQHERRQTTSVTPQGARQNTRGRERQSAAGSVKQRIAERAANAAAQPGHAGRDLDNDV